MRLTPHWGPQKARPRKHFEGTLNQCSISPKRVPVANRIPNSNALPSKFKPRPPVMQICNANHIEVGQEKQCTLVDPYNSENTGGQLIYNNHQTECKTKVSELSNSAKARPNMAYHIHRYQYWQLAATDPASCHEAIVASQQWISCIHFTRQDVLKSTYIQTGWW